MGSRDPFIGDPIARADEAREAAVNAQQHGTRLATRVADLDERVARLDERVALLEQQLKLLVLLVKGRM